MHPEKNTNNLNWQKALDIANSAKRCGAKTRSSKTCKSPAMLNGRCRMHGGKSTGAPCGKAHGNYKHGRYTNNAIQCRRKGNHLLRKLELLFPIPQPSSASNYLEYIGVSVDEINTIENIKDTYVKVWEALQNQKLTDEESEVIFTYLFKQNDRLIKERIDQLVKMVRSRQLND